MSGDMQRLKYQPSAKLVQGCPERSTGNVQGLPERTNRTEQLSRFFRLPPLEQLSSQRKPLLSSGVPDLAAAGTQEAGKPSVWSRTTPWLPADLQVTQCKLWQAK